MPAENITGSVELVGEFALDWLSAEERRATRDALSPAALTELLQPLQRRRIIAWRNANHGLNRMSRRLPDLPLPDPWSTPAAHDCEHWYGYWLH
ncbi:hypothetical protein ACL02S_22795 [Nocardia sp. 004]|uniref:hypothetical protein n=1 Tax=Nocardia sp. 004 TaxID=3385978 RepID=UPI00399F0E82